MIERLDIDWYEPGIEDKIGDCVRKINEIIGIVNGLDNLKVQEIKDKFGIK